jgi:DNA modification methylase
VTFSLHHGDCLEVMASLPDASVDLILCDLPYGTTACKWDTVIPFEPLWAQYRRVAKRNAAIVLTASQPFTTALIASNMREFRIEWIWNKRRAGNFFAVKREPLRVHESVLVFARALPTYNPQMAIGEPYKITRRSEGAQAGAYGVQKRTGMVNHGTRHPTTVLEYGSANTNKLHPTQKPVALMEYLIRTYTNEGDVVLDNCMGSGTTGVACANTGRRFIGIERDPKYFEIARDRIAAAHVAQAA